MKTASERVELRSSEGRPSLSLVERQGDPFAAVALAVAHDQGSAASVALGALIEHRLLEAGTLQLELQAHQLGFQLQALASNAKQAAHFLGIASQALAAKVTPSDPALPLVRKRLEQLQARSLAGPGAVNVATCSGELGLTSDQASKLKNSPNLAAKLEGFRSAAYSVGAASFGALGPRALLDQVAEAHAKLPEWPAGEGPEDPWPKADSVSLDPSDGRPTLSLAVRIPDPSRALQAARQLGRRGSTLTHRLGALSPAWKVRRTAGTARPRGACVRLDLELERSSNPRLESIAQAAAIAKEELGKALGRATTSPWTLDDNILRPADPREAAGLAAWRALTERKRPGPQRQFIHYTGQNTDLTGGALARALAELSQRDPKLEHQVRVEPGQGEFWMLLASPCGTRIETAHNAGVQATLLRSLASRGTPSGTQIEPWVTPSGVGLLVHGPRRTADETPRAHAVRLANTLSRVFIASRPSGSDVAHARAQLLDEIGPGPRPAWSLMLDSLSPDRPSRLEPRGTFRSLTELAVQDVRAHQQLLLHGPLRLSVIANHDAAQARAAIEAVESWLRPLRKDIHECSAAEPQSPRRGELTLQLDDADSPSSAFVAVSALKARPGAFRAAQATTLLLNRQGGWLDQALMRPGLAASATARLLGGAEGLALVVEVRAEEEKLKTAVAQVRALLDRLADGAASHADLSLAKSTLSAFALRTSLEPRQRIVQLFRKESKAPVLSLESLRQFQRTLGAEAHLVVYALAQK